MSKETEPVCEVTGKPCAWLADEEHGDDGEIVAWDLFCGDCGRSRDWEKNAAQGPSEP